MAWAYIKRENTTEWCETIKEILNQMDKKEIEASIAE